MPIRKEWGMALLHAVPVTAVVLVLFYYWFAVADRYIVFLYNHDMGPFVPDTSPFSAVTASRYWMTGLVAGGIVTVLYAAANWLAGRLVRDYRPPGWWFMWVICCGPLVIAIPLITMTLNAPTLPALNATQVTLAALIGLGLALIPGKLAAESPGELLLLSLDGGAIAALLLSVSMIERMIWTLARGVVWPSFIIAAGFAVAIVLLLITTGLRLWQQLAWPGTIPLFIAGLIVAYLILPAIHHFLGTDGYYYISDKDNFFSWSWIVQAIAWFVTLVIAKNVTWLREYLTKLRVPFE